MSSIIKKIKNKVAFFLMLSLSIFSCQKSQEINAVVYKRGSKIKEFNGSFYSTKYGGLNYYISNENDRNELFNIQNIDSIMFIINGKSYSAEPLIRKPFSRERNNSDFSFSVDKKYHKIIVDTINNIYTLSIFSEKTDMEEMKNNKVIEFKYVEL